LLHTLLLLGKWPSYSPLSLQKKRKRRLYKLPRSGILSRESPLPRLRGERPSLSGSHFRSSEGGKDILKRQLLVSSFPPLCRAPGPRPQLQLLDRFRQLCARRWRCRRLPLGISRVRGRDSSGADAPGQRRPGRSGEQGQRVWLGAAGACACYFREPEQR
jgi:hypothetical protein